MVLLAVHSLSKSFGTQSLFKDISFSICSGDRIGLLGPNGAGKSTLLKILVGQETQDDGSISKQQGLVVGYAGQDPEIPALSLEEVLVQQVPRKDEIEALTKARILLGKSQFADFSVNAEVLSGGWKKRLDICRALMHDPDLLLFDEPTNHLDLEGILWLEKFLNRERIPYIVVSHDRYFLENVSNKIIELNKCYPQGLFISDGNMSVYAEHKEAFLQGQIKEERGLASTVRDEIDWLRRSPKARTTKSQSRVQRAHELIGELSEIQKRNKSHKVSIDFNASERETRKLLVAKNLSKTLGNRELFKGIDLTLSPGTRLGIVGTNGTGKTTLLKVLAGMLPQDIGTVKYAEDLSLVYFDQHRESLPADISLREALAPVNDHVIYRGQSIHVNGWAKKFLFTPDRLKMPIKCLSGGERARILIAKLMLKPADILFLDEPTNDLDIATLEVIEESLKEFVGAVVMISHDRCLMDRVCTQILGLGKENEQIFFADYRQWEKSIKSVGKKEEANKNVSLEKASVKKLSYKEQKELEGIEKQIESAEAEIASFQLQLENSLLHADAEKLLEVYRLLSEAEKKHSQLYERWQFLEAKSL